MRKFLLIALCPLLVFLVSCQQGIDDTITQADIDPLLANDSAYLRYEAYVDTTQPAGQDTVIRTYYFYDAQKRFVRSEETSLWNTDSITERRFYRLVTDTLPYLTVERTYSPFRNNTLYLDSTFLTYQNGLMTRDSVVRYQNGVLSSYRRTLYTIVSGTSVTELGKAEVYYPGYPTEFFYDTTYYTNIIRTNGNIVHVDMMYHSSSVAENDTLTDVAEWDSKANPFIRFALFKPYDPFVSKNNFTRTLRTRPTHPTPSIDVYSWEYRADGYPVILRTQDPNSVGVIEYQKTIFSYMRL